MLCNKIDTAILAFFNSVQTPEVIINTIRDESSDRSYGIRSVLAKTIIESRDQLPNKQFTSVIQLSQIPQLGKETMDDIFRTFLKKEEEDNFIVINEKVRMGDSIQDTWLHEELAFILEIPLNDCALLKKVNGDYYPEPIDLIYSEEYDAFSFIEIPPIIENLLSTDPIGKSVSHSEVVGQVLLDRVTDNLLEISFNGNAWVLEQSTFPEQIIYTKATAIAFEESKDYLINREQELILNDINNADLDEDAIRKALPSWWTDEDTEKFLEELAKLVKDEIDLIPDPTEKALELIIEKKAAKLLAKTLAKMEGKRILNKLIKEGKSKKEAEKIVNGLLKKLEKDYLYKKKGIIKRFNPLTKVKNLKTLLKSPKTWLRGKVAKFFIKGLGKRVLAIPGLVDDLYTIGEAIYRWWQAQKAWEGAKESAKQADEMEERLRKMIRDFTPEQRKRYEDRKKRQAEFFKRLREEQRQKALKKLGQIS